MGSIHSILPPFIPSLIRQRRHASGAVTDVTLLFFSLSRVAVDRRRGSLPVATETQSINNVTSVLRMRDSGVVIYRNVVGNLF